MKSNSLIRNNGNFLTEEQNKIINEKIYKNIRIIAGAGCGKTTTILHRIKHLINNGIDSSSIILTTFTRDAAKDMKYKLINLIGENEIITGTIDSISYNIVSKYRPEKINEETHVGEYKIELYKFLSEKDNDKVNDFFSEIQYLFVDEYQDINQDYFNLIKLFYNNDVKICSVGDDAQNIYTWNGSDIKFILEFTNFFKNTRSHFLTNNFRSTPEIVELANNIITHNKCQIPKNIKANKTSVDFLPHVIYSNTWKNEIEYIIKCIVKHIEDGYKLHDICILSRNCTANGPLYFIESELSKKNLDCILLENTDSEEEEKIKKNNIILSTIHKSKGLEWSIVFLVGCNDNHFPSNKTLESIEEERRLFYVAVTRSKKYLYMLLSGINFNNSTILSRFITENNKSLYKFINVTSDLIGNCGNDIVKKKSIQNIENTFKNISTEDISNLRNNMLKDIKFKRKKLNYVNDNVNADINLPEEFIRCLVCRQIYELNEKDIYYYYADSVVSRVVVSSEEFLIYKKYSIIFNKYLENCKYGNRNDLLKSLIEENRNITENEIKIIYKIINKIHKNARIYNLPIERVTVFSNYLIPSNFVNEVETAYKNYKNKKYKWQEILYDIYIVSLAKNILDGRLHFLYKKISKKKISSYLELYQNIYYAYVKKCCILDNNPNLHFMYEDIDFRIDNICGDKLINYVISEKNIDILDKLKLLFCCKVMQKNSFEIKGIQQVNLLKGYIYECNISEWKDGEELLYLVEEKCNRNKMKEKQSCHSTIDSSYIMNIDDTEEFIY